MVRSIVFDMGNVLIPYDPGFLMDALDIPARDRALFSDQVFCSVEWASIDRGALSEAQAAERMCARLPAHLHAACRAVFDTLHRHTDPFEDMAALVGALKAAGYPVYLLSNASAYYAAHVTEMIPAAAVMDGRLFSCEVGLLKPDPAIYHAFCRRFGLEIQSCFFIDDSFLNIEAALHAGMQGYLYRRDTPALRAALAAAGVTV